MAERGFPVKGEPAGLTLPAAFSLAAILAAVGLGLLPIIFGFGITALAFDAYLFRVLRFTLLQAGLSTIISVTLALPLARALARQRFPGHSVIVGLLSVPLALPPIVAALGLVSAFTIFASLIGPLTPYGLFGILLAHVFFNLPLAARYYLLRLGSVPSEQWKLAEQLGLNGSQIWRTVEWPALRSTVPAVALLIFLLCAASFTIVLTLGGGPSATTLEVAIYQALRLDFDPARAVSLAVVQLALCACVTMLMSRSSREIDIGQSLQRPIIRYDGKSTFARMMDMIAIAAAAIFVSVPILAAFADATIRLSIPATVTDASLMSLAIGFGSAIIALGLSWPLAWSTYDASGRSWLYWLISHLSFMIPPAVLATGWFILNLRSPIQAGPAFLVIALNSLMALPFVYNLLAGAIARHRQQTDRLCASLGVMGATRLRLIDLPLLRRYLMIGLLTAWIVSLGDLTAITLFGSQDFVTLPALIYRQMGSYRMDEAATSSIVLCALVFMLGLLLNRLSRTRAESD